MIGGVTIKRFEVDLFNFFNKRQDESHNLLQKDPKYQQVLIIHEEVMQEIEELTGKELMMKFDSIDTQLSAIKDDYLYRQGFSDGMKLIKLIEGVIPESASACYEELRWQREAVFLRIFKTIGFRFLMTVESCAAQYLLC